MRTRLIAPVLLALVLAGCASQPGAQNPSPTPSDVASTGTSVQSPTPTGSPTPTVTEPEQAPAPTADQLARACVDHVRVALQLDDVSYETVHWEQLRAGLRPDGLWISTVPYSNTAPEIVETESEYYCILEWGAAEEFRGGGQTAPISQELYDSWVAGEWPGGPGQD